MLKLLRKLANGDARYQRGYEDMARRLKEHQVSEEELSDLAVFEAEGLLSHEERGALKAARDFYDVAQRGSCP